MIVSQCCNESISRPTPGKGDWTCNNCHGVVSLPTWEVFNWRTGKIVDYGMTEQSAKRWAWSLGDDYDYAREGEGY